MVTARTPLRHHSMVSECTLQRAGPLTSGTVKADWISAGRIDGFMNKWMDTYMHACMRMGNTKMICDIKHSKAPVTPCLRPGTCDRKMLQSWANRRKNLRLVTEVVGDRQGKISRSKVVVLFNTQSHRAYDQVMTYLRSKNNAIVGKS